jgi:hypothetical protein
MDTLSPAGPAEPDDEAGQRQEGEPGQAEDEAGEEPAPAVHYSTGRLTRAQAGLVNAWRDRLREDKPLPGRPPVGGLARLLGASDRPPASCSDAVAAAVAELLGQRPPAPLDLARYAYAGMKAQQAAAAGRGAEDTAPLYPPVSWYLPADIAEQAEELRAAAYSAVVEAVLEVRREANERHPGGTREAAVARALFESGELARLRLPFVRQIPRGAIARMGIDRWARRSPARVAADAVAYAADAHEQPHRARADMHKLQR